MTRHTVLLLGNYRPALSVARSLSDAGHRVIVSRDSSEAGAAGRSRAVGEVWETPHRDDSDTVFPALAEFLAARRDITAVFPLMESYIHGMRTHGASLPRDRVYVMPNDGAVDSCLDKGRLLNVVDRAGLPVARSQTVNDVAALRHAVADLGYPLVVKPTDSTIWLGTRKALILRSEADFRTAFPDWPDGHTALIVQRYVEGPRLNLYFAAQRGVAIRYLAVEIGETDMPDGTGLATTGVSIPLDDELRALGDVLIAQLGYRGVGCIQVLRDRTSGQLSFLEINPRIGGNHAVTVHAGLDLEHLALALAAGDPVEDQLIIGRAGVRYVWTTGALRGVGLGWRNGELSTGRAIATAVGALWTGLSTRRHVTFALSDPLPTLTLLSRLGRG